MATLLPGAVATPVVDRDEARFAQASRQMFEAVALPAAQQDPALHAGGLLVPQVGESPRINKPPLIYWLQTVAAAIATGGDPGADAIWMYRLPSVLAAAFGVLATWWVAGRLFARRPDAAALALLAGGMLAGCPIYAWDARQARADQVMVACTTIAMAALWCAGRRHVERSRLRSLLLPHTLLWAAVALGVLAKGPITPMVVGCTLIAYRVTARRALVPWRWVGAGLVLVLVLLAPWFIAVGGAIGWERLGEVLHAELIERSASAKEGHAGPPGYHLVLLAAVRGVQRQLLPRFPRRSFLRGWRRRGSCLSWSPRNSRITRCRCTRRSPSSQPGRWSPRRDCWPFGNHRGRTHRAHWGGSSGR